MHFVNSIELARELVSGKLNEDSKLKHYTASMILTVMMYFFNRLISGDVDNNHLSHSIVPEVLGYLFSISAIIFGIKIIKNANKSIDDKNIIERIAVLSLPASFWTYLIMYLIGFLSSFLLSDVAYHIVYAHVISMPLSYIIILGIIAYSLGKVNGNDFPVAATV